MSVVQRHLETADAALLRERCRDEKRGIVILMATFPCERDHFVGVDRSQKFECTVHVLGE